MHGETVNKKNRIFRFTSFSCLP